MATRSDPSLLDVLNNMQIILNNGQYQLQQVSTVPTFTGVEGQLLLYVSGTVRRLYFYDITNATWHFIEWDASGSNGAGPPLTQAFTNQTTVTVTHNLGFMPIVQILNSTNTVMEAQITHSSVNAFTVTFAQLTTGTILY